MPTASRPLAIVIGACSGGGSYAAKRATQGRWFADLAHPEIMIIHVGSQQSMRDFAAAFLASGWRA